MRRGKFRAGLCLLPSLVLGMCLALAAVQALAATGATQPPDQPAVRLQDIIVISTQPGVDITPEKTVIELDEFHRPAGVRTLTDVLSEIGGLDVQRISPLMSSPGDEVSIRGLNEGRMVIEIDGRRINHTGHSGRYIVDWSTLNLDNVERIEIIRGGHSVLHPFAIGGVINIITKKGKKTADWKPDAKVDAGYGSFNTHYEAFSMNGGVDKWLGYALSASNGATDGYLRNNYQKNKNINGTLSFYLPRDMTLTLGIKHANIEYGFPVLNDPSRADYNPDYPIFKGTADQLRHVPSTAQLPGPPIPYWTRDVTYLDAIFDVPFSNGAFKLHGFSTEGKRWIHSYSGTNYTNSYSDDLTRGIIAEYRDLKIGEVHSLTIGMDYQQLGYPSEENQTIGYPRMRDAIYNVKSAYAQDVIRLGQWTITPGVRYYSVDGDTYYSWFENGGSSPSMPTTGKTNHDDGFYPSLKVDYQATKDTVLYAAASRSYRLPCP